MPAPSDGPDQAVPRSRRDPVARRRAITQAAADLLVEGGDLTHRRVADRAGVPLGSTTYYFADLGELREAALNLLAEGLDEAFAETRQQTAEADGDPDVLASQLYDYLCDRDRLRADAALQGAALQRPELRHLERRWADNMAELLSAWTSPINARLVAAFVDGVGVHALLHDEPLDRAALSRAITALMRLPAAGEEKK
ncbi:TetR family transcriptional regulator [Actinosynnema sp. ALI-1.44]|uniref:TetR/AcrR family transcriptional regulator n=1 Tax=Actinosynnema sp. ALI-1.44 TaxID=1933779 RepID=UPI00097CB672|nr:TetR family transcriptional regulator [Actinosynnema sp. ALI-1.44]ONI89345.1 TetR family transcriptional regulator [Actinosynnema sp. ALI-1.44]